MSDEIPTDVQLTAEDLERLKKSDTPLEQWPEVDADIFAPGTFSDQGLSPARMAEIEKMLGNAQPFWFWEHAIRDLLAEVRRLRGDALFFREQIKQLHRAGCVTFDQLDELANEVNGGLFGDPQSPHFCRMVDILNRRHAHRAVVKQNEELRARVAELESRERWVPVGERLPEKSIVLGWDPNVKFPMLAAGGSIGIDSRYTHWRALPEGPKA